MPLNGKTPRKFTLMWLDGVLNIPHIEQFETQAGPGGSIIYPERAQNLIMEHNAKISWDDEREWYE